MILRRDPPRHLIENPKLLEHISIGDHRGFRWDFLCPRRGGIANFLERGGSARGRRECRHPAAKSLRSPDRVALFLEVPINDSLEVAIELGSQRSARQSPDAREARGDDFVGVVDETDFCVAFDFRLCAAEQVGQADSRLAQPSLGQAERSHSDTHDPAGPGMARWLCRGCRASEKKPSRGRVSIDCGAYGIPQRRHMLPLIQQHWRRVLEQHGWVRGRDGPHFRHVNAMHGRRATFCGRSFAHRLGSFECDGGELWKKLIELAIDDSPRVIGHG